MAEEPDRTIGGYRLHLGTDIEWITFKLHVRALPVPIDDKRMVLQEAADFLNRRLTQKDYIEAGVLLIEPMATGGEP